MRTWVDASTIIALDLAGEIDVLRALLGQVALTQEIAGEVFTGRESRALRAARGSWIEVVEVRGNRRPWAALGLGPGEASLFLTPAGDRLVLDEVPTRTVAEAEGREYVGLLGLLLAGVRKGLLTRTRAREVLRRVVEAGFHLATHLYDAFLAELEKDGWRRLPQSP